VEIDNYLAVRRTVSPDEHNHYLLAGKKHQWLTREQLYALFRQVVKDIGLEQPRRRTSHMTFGAPTPHCLRHSFAINTLKRIRDQAKDPQHALPVLAAYMGHQEYRRTGAYLKVNDANHLQGLIQFAKSRFDQL